MECVLFSEGPTINLAYVAFAVLVVTLADLAKALFPNVDVVEAMRVG